MYYTPAGSEGGREKRMRFFFFSLSPFHLSNYYYILLVVRPTIGHQRLPFIGRLVLNFFFLLASDDVRCIFCTARRRRKFKTRNNAAAAAAAVFYTYRFYRRPRGLELFRSLSNHKLLTHVHIAQTSIITSFYYYYHSVLI